MNDEMQLREEVPNYEICFNADNEWKIKIHTDTGRVELAEGIDIDEASELFWTVLAGESPKALLDEIAALKREVEHYKANSDIANSDEEQRVSEFELAMISLVENPDGACRADLEYFNDQLTEGLKPTAQRSDYDRAMKVIE